jgi:hypothetical protein
MQVELDHVLFWMDAIRNSIDPVRTLEAFWKGQIKSKMWLINNLNSVHNKDDSTIHVLGGWVGVLPSLLFQHSDFSIKHITSIDIDPTCRETCLTMNKIEEMNGRFSSITDDMTNTISNSDITINTSCEHITQDQYDLWLSKQSNDTTLVLQSNDYIIPEHVRIANDLNHFIEQSHIEVIYAGELELPLYKRFMLIGRKI